MTVGLGHSLRARLALGSLVVALALLADSASGIDPASADPVPLPPVLTPPPAAPQPVKPPLAPPKESKGPLKPYVPPTKPTKSLLPETKISSGEQKAKEKAQKTKEKEEEELKNDKGHGACRHGFGSSITNKLSVSCMTEQAVDKIFGLPDGFGTQKLLRGLLKVPDFVGDSPAEGVSNAEWLTESIAFALLMAAVTFTLFHYFAAGMMSGGGSGMFVDGVTRCVGAALMILAWPFIFENAANITNVITNTLIPESSIDGGVGMLANAAEAGGTLGAGLLVMIVFAVLMLILLMVKIGLLTGLMIAFVGTPLALALWPIPSLSGPATYALRFVGMVFTVVILWAVCLRIFGAVNTEFRGWGGHNLGVGEKLLLPLVGLGSLLALLSIPRHAVQMWNVAPQRGTVSSMFQYAASSVIANSVRGGGRQAAGARKAGGGQARPGGGANPGGGKRPGGGTAGPGASGGGRTGGGRGGGGGPAPAVAAAAQAGGAARSRGVSQATRSGSGGARDPRRGGSASAPPKGKSGGGGGSSRQQPSRRRGQGASAKPAGGQSAGRGAAGGGRSAPATRPQGSGASGGPAGRRGGGGGGGTGRAASTSPPPRGTQGSGAQQARPDPRRPDPGTGGPPPGRKPPRPGPTSHQKPPPPSK
ncbi:MAG: hypothetical protein JST08_20600 [Actinobacteria bacterium]|nr:hypothetical protein [Actinomycetota bacterium]